MDRLGIPFEQLPQRSIPKAGDRPAKAPSSAHFINSISRPWEEPYRTGI